MRYVDPDGCENKDWINGEHDDDDVWVPGHAHIPAFVGMGPEDKDPWAMAYWFFAFFGLMFGVNVPVLLASQIHQLAGALAAAGSKVASAVMSGLKSAWSILSGMSLKKIALILVALYNAIRALNDAIGFLGHRDVYHEFFKWGFVLTAEDKIDKSKWGWVTILGEQDYRWKALYLGNEKYAYYVKIDGEWVLMPDNWTPGDPIPEEYLT